MCKLKSILCICICFYCCGLTASYAASSNVSTPLDSLTQIQLAIDEANGENFQNLIDLDNIGNNALNSFLKLMQSPDYANQLPPMLSIIFGQLNSQNQIRSLLLNEGKAFVINGVTSGNFAGKSQNNSITNPGFLAPLFADASLGKKQITNIGEPTRDGEHWLVPFVIHDEGNGNSYPIIGKFELQNGICRLTDIANFDQIFTQIAKESGLK